MSNYIIEDDIDFFKELTSDDTHKDVPRCLITGNELVDDHVCLPCNHTFNYDAILKDTYTHKRTTNAWEDITIPIKSLRCPYCRVVHLDYLLPTHPDKPKLFGVNYYSPDLDFKYEYISIPKCSYEPCTYTIGNIRNGEYVCRTHIRRQITKELNNLDSIYDQYKIKCVKSIINAKLGYCDAILKSGKRKGESCGRVCVSNGKMCTIHNKK